MVGVSDPNQEPRYCYYRYGDDQRWNNETATWVLHFWEDLTFHRRSYKMFSAVMIKSTKKNACIVMSDLDAMI